MREDERPWAKELSESSAALREIVGAVIRSEQQYTPAQSPLALLRAIQEDPNWAWLKPLYQLVADIDHAADDAELPATEVAAIGAHARALLSGVGVPIEQTFLDRYRPLLQTNPPSPSPMATRCALYASCHLSLRPKRNACMPTTSGPCAASTIGVEN